MELPRILIDTSIVIEHLRKQNRRKSILYRIADEYALYALNLGHFDRIERLQLLSPLT